MDVSVLGLGYVGCVTMGCLAQLGHRVVGVDVNQHKVDLINEGKATIVEEAIGTIIAAQRAAGHISATADAAAAIAETDVSLACVGTPSTEKGSLDIEHVFHVAEQIGAALASKDTFHTVAIRSTVAPGTNKRFTEIVAEKSGKAPGDHFAVVSNPEFLREGSGVADFFNPPMIVLGCDTAAGLDALKGLYKGINAPIFETQVGVAEMIKYVNNSFHALKVSFANEVGRICKTLDVDARELMRVFCADRQLNVSPAYLQPGAPYGGSCLPKDLSALRALARDNYVSVPIIDAIRDSNEEQIRAALKLILDAGKKRIAFLGLSFKAGTDDLRNSPAVDLVEQLIGKGCQLAIHDESVVYSNLTGRNREYVNAHLPHVAKLLVYTIEEASRTPN